jgi:hypothetical protein
MIDLIGSEVQEPEGGATATPHTNAIMTLVQTAAAVCALLPPMDGTKATGLLAIFLAEPSRRAPMS